MNQGLTQEQIKACMDELYSDPVYVAEQEAIDELFRKHMDETYRDDKNQ